MTEKTLKELRNFIPPEGTFITNPLDIGVVLRDIGLLLRSLEPISADPLIDSIIFVMPVQLVFGTMNLSVLGSQDQPAIRAEIDKQVGVVLDSIIKFNRENVPHKPLIMALQAGIGPLLPGGRARVQQELIKAKIPVYLNLDRASRALSKFIQYHEYHNKSG
jgi:hypothetical protein